MIFLLMLTTAEAYNIEVMDKLRNVKPYELIKTSTDRFKKSFIL